MGQNFGSNGAIPVGAQHGAWHTTSGPSRGNQGTGLGHHKPRKADGRVGGMEVCVNVLVVKDEILGT